MIYRTLEPHYYDTGFGSVVNQCNKRMRQEGEGGDEVSYLLIIRSFNSTVLTNFLEIISSVSSSVWLRL